MKRYAIIAVSVSLIMMSSSPTTIDYEYKEDPKTIRAIPPTFITLDPIPDCDENRGFPQTNPLPGFRNAKHVQFSCDYYEKDHVAWVMYIFYDLWEKEFGDEDESLRAALDNLKIVWGKDAKEVSRVYDMDGNFLEKAVVAGLMESDECIWVWAEDEDLSETSLVHELVHIALSHTCGDADADHEGLEYPCWDERHTRFIDDINQVLKSTYSL